MSACTGNVCVWGGWGWGGTCWVTQTKRAYDKPPLAWAHSNSACLHMTCDCTMRASFDQVCTYRGLKGSQGAQGCERKPILNLRACVCVVAHGPTLALRVCSYKSSIAGKYLYRWPLCAVQTTRGTYMTPYVQRIVHIRGTLHSKNHNRKRTNRGPTSL